MLAHARALLTSGPEGGTDFIKADMRDPGEIIRQASRMLDFSQPVGLMMLGILGQIPDSDNPGLIVTRLLEALPPGSYLALSDGTDTSPELNDAIRAYNQNAANSYYLRSPHYLRSPQQIAGLFARPAMVPPGVVTTSR